MFNLLGKDHYRELVISVAGIGLQACFIIFCFDMYYLSYSIIAHFNIDNINKPEL